ncbi:MAG: hypothetical protein HQL33_01905 [Alphaproteobacteria bacterium]|nr:hypothetical protein [Alphaproteobacteria bacterium]
MGWYLQRAGLIVGALVLLLAQTVAVDAQTWIGTVDARGKTKEEAETYAAREAVQRALIDHYGVTANNPLIGIIAGMDADKLKNEFLRPPTGALRKFGDSYAGRLEYELNDVRFQEIVDNIIRSELLKLGISKIAFAVIATSTATKLDGGERAKITNDLARTFGDEITRYGLSGASIPPDLMRTIIDKGALGGLDSVTAIIKDIDGIVQKASVTEGGKSDVVIAGYFNIFETNNDKRTINWEMSGTIYDFRIATNVAQARKNVFYFRGEDIGKSFEVALREAYRTSAKQLLYRNMLNNVFSNLTVPQGSEALNR